MKKPILILALMLLGGCAQDPTDVLRGPQLSPVGDGLRTQAYPIPVTPAGPYAGQLSFHLGRRHRPLPRPARPACR